MVIVRSFFYLSLTTGLLLNILSVDGSAAERDAMEGVIGGKNLNPKIRPRQEDQEDDDSNESSKKKFKRSESYTLPERPSDIVPELPSKNLGIIACFRPEEKDSLIRRTSDITRPQHRNRTSNILELNNNIRDAWDLSERMYSGNEGEKKKINDLAQSQNLQERRIAVEALRNLVQQNNQWAKERINDLAQSQNLPERGTGVWALRDLVRRNNGWAKERVSNFAQSQNLQDQDIAALALRELVDYNNEWAEEKINDLAQSQNLQDQDIAAWVLKELVLQNNQWARERLTIFKK